MKAFLFVVACSFAALSSVATTTAVAGEFSMNASSCTADSGSIQANRYLNTAGTTKHASTATGTITLYCPVNWSDSLTSPTRIDILYSDSTATASNNVSASFIKMNKSNGGLTVIRTVDSDQTVETFCNNGGSISVCYRTFSETISTTTNYYYVRVDITRSSTSNTEVLYGVRIY